MVWTSLGSWKEFNIWVVQAIHDKISLNICSVELLEEFCRDKNEFEWALVNKPSVFELLKFSCIW